MLSARLEDLKQSRGGRAIRGGALFGLSYAIDTAIDEVDCGPMRAPLHLASSALAFQGGIEFAIVSGASGLVALFVPDFTIAVRVASGAVAIGSGYLSYSSFRASYESYHRGFKEAAGDCKR